MKLDPDTPTAADPIAVQKLRDVRWLFFDVGYTLLDETGGWQDQFERLAIESNADRRGNAVSVDDCWTAYREACATFAPGQWRAVCERVAPANVARYMALNQSWRHDLETPYPGVADTLTRLATRYKLGVIANQAHGTRDRLIKHGLWTHMSVIASSAEAGVNKPDPAIFQLALREANCEPHQAAMVGDRLDNDVAPANRLGMMSVHVLQGGSATQRPRTPDEVATLTVQTVPELADVLIPSPSGRGLG